VVDPSIPTPPPPREHLSHRLDSNQRPTVYEPQGAVNVFKRLGCLLTNGVRLNVFKS
jgi:hypothetical protein